MGEVFIVAKLNAIKQKQKVYYFFIFNYKLIDSPKGTIEQ
jgi:hypothetical protein